MLLFEYMIELKVDHHMPNKKSYWTKWFREDMMESTFTNMETIWNQHNKQGNVLKTPCHVETTSWLKVSWHSYPHELMASMTRPNLWFEHQIGLIIILVRLVSCKYMSYYNTCHSTLSARKIEITTCNSIKTQPMYGATRCYKPHVNFLQILELELNWGRKGCDDVHGEVESKNV